MIRKLMASSAVLALMTAGTFGIAQAQTEPAQTDQPAAVQLQQTETPAATDTQAQQEPAVTEDTQAQQEPSATDATATDQAADTAAAGTSDTKLTPEEPTLATAFIGRSVFSSEDPESDNIGDVNDLIIDDDGTITHAVVGVGGFLGIGEKDVAVPFDELQVVERDGEIRLVYAATKEQLQAAEEFDRTAYDPKARNAAEQAANQPAVDTTGMGGGLATAPAGGMAPAAPADQAATETDTSSSQDTAVSADTSAGSADTTAPEQMAAGTDTGSDTSAAGSDQQMAADTSTQPADQTAATNESAGGESGFLSFNADQVRASTLMGKEVYGQDDQSIGEISDLVVQQDGETRAALIDVGGFLGVGEKRVAIPFDQIQITPAQDNGEPKLTVAMAKEQIEQLPEFQDETMGSQDTAANQAPDQTGSTSPAEQSATADSTQPADQDMAAGTDTQAGDQMQTVSQNLSADQLIGAPVYGTGDENLGDVDDVVFDKTGGIKAVVVDVGGFLGVGEKPVAVEFDALNVQKDDNGGMRLSVDATEEQLKNAPAYNEQAAQ